MRHNQLIRKTRTRNGTLTQSSALRRSLVLQGDGANTPQGIMNAARMAAKLAKKAASLPEVVSNFLTTEFEEVEDAVQDFLAEMKGYQDEELGIRHYLRALWLYEADYTDDCLLLQSFFKEALHDQSGASLVTNNLDDLIEAHVEMMDLLNEIMDKPKSAQDDPELVLQVFRLIGFVTFMHKQYATEFKESTDKFEALTKVKLFRRVMHETPGGIGGIQKLRWEPMNHIVRFWVIGKKCIPLDARVKPFCVELFDLIKYMDLVASRQATGGALEVVDTAPVLSTDRFGVASFHLYSASIGKDERKVQRNPEARGMYRLYHRFQLAATIVGILMVVLFLFEQPSYCYGPHLSCDVPPYGAPSGSVLYHSNIPKMNIYLGCCLELLLIVAWFFSATFFRLKFLLKPPLNFYVILVVQVLSVGDIIITMLMGAAGIYRVVRLSVWLRPLILILITRSARRAFYAVLGAFIATLPVLSLLFLFVLVFSLCATLLWANQGFQFFNDFGLTIRELHVLLTTANFPDVMLPSFYDSRWTFLFYALFMSLGFVLLLNIVLSEVYGSFIQSIASRKEEFYRNRSYSLEAAFRVLSQEGDQVHRASIIGVLEGLQAYGVGGDNNNETKLKMRVDMLLGPEGEWCSRKVFINDILPTAMLSIQSKESALMRQCRARLKHQHWLVTFVRSTAFEVIMFLIILLNAISICVATWANLTGGDPLDQANPVLFALEQLFLCLFIVEAIVKLIAFGFKLYFRTYLLDFLVLLLGIGLDIYFLVVRDGATGLVLVASTVRLLRILQIIPVYRRLFASIFTMINLFTPLLPSVAMIYLYFGLIGIELFGGKLYEGNPLLDGTIYAGANYFAVNWNDMGMAFVNEFALLIVNNWFVIADGAEAVTHAAARIYFIVYWLFSVLILLNIAVTLILDSASRAEQTPTGAASKLIKRFHKRLKRAKGNEDPVETLGGASVISLQDGQYTFDAEEIEMLEELERVAADIQVPDEDLDLASFAKKVGEVVAEGLDDSVEVEVLEEERYSVTKFNTFQGRASALYERDGREVTWAGEEGMQVVLEEDEKREQDVF